MTIIHSVDKYLVRIFYDAPGRNELSSILYLEGTSVHCHPTEIAI